MGDLEEGKDKPKYAKLRKGQTIDGISLKEALSLFDLPRTIGQFEEKEVVVSEGRYGPYVKYNKGFVSLGDLDPNTVDLDTCIELIKAKQAFEKQKLITSFDFNDSVIQICNGKYGPYVKVDKKNYKIPKDLDPQKMTKEDCVNLIDKSSKK